jgi:hypothetical protein
VLSWSAATSNSIVSRLTLLGLSAAIALMAASGIAAQTASAAGTAVVFIDVDCSPTQVAVGQSTSCSVRVSHELPNPNENLPTGSVTFSDSRGTGTFNPANSCTLTPNSPFSSGCSVSFSGPAGGRTIKGDYPGDNIHQAGSDTALVKVFVPGATRFAKPGGTGVDPCTDQANPCSLFAAASFQAPGTSIVPGAEVVLAGGVYGNADLGGQPNLNLESGITLRGEAGVARPVITLAGGVFGGSEKIRHIEIQSTGGSTALFTRGSTVEDVVARTSAAGATACSLDTGILRDSACLSTGAGGAGAGSAAFTETGETFQPRMRNVTAVATGTPSVGMRFEIQSLGAAPGELNPDLGSVIAKGRTADVQAKNPSFGAPAGQVHIALDHSDYATIDPKDPSGSVTITPPGDVAHANITADPQLATDNIHQTFSSPTIDKGVIDGVFSGSNDVDGEARKQGAQVDIGADEITPANDTETLVTCKATSVFTGEGTKCTATVTDKGNNSPARPIDGGTLTFKDNAQANGSLTPTTCTLVPINPTQASCGTEIEFKSTTVANHGLEASFATDGKGHIGSTSPPLTVEVKARPNDTDTKLSCKAATLFSGETTKCSVTVTDKANNRPANSMAGVDVSFKDNTETAAFSAPATCRLVEVTTTTASCQTELDFKPTAVANHALEASYPGDAAHNGSIGTLSVQVKQPPNNTETKLSCKVASLITGESTKCTATVTDKANKGPARSLAGGVVTFKDNTQLSAFTAPATCTLVEVTSTTGTCQTELDFKPTTVANHALEASLTADEFHLTSTGTLSFEVKAKPNTTETELRCKVGSLISGESTKCTAEVTDTSDNNPASPLAGGIVTFEDSTEAGAFSPATCTLVRKNATQGVCQVEVDFKPNTVAIHTLKASYPGDDGKHAPSVSPTVNFTVTPRPQPNGTRTELTCKVPSMFSGETTKCNATVTDKLDNGPPASLEGILVTFVDKTEPAAFPQPASCRLVRLNATQASCEVEVDFRPNTVANHALEASYPGDAAHTGSTGTLSIQVNPQRNDTETKLTCKATTLITGESTKCTAEVADKANNSAGSPLGGGTVTFKDNTQQDAISPTTCTLANLTNTTASCQIEVDFKPTVVGNHALEATFAGDAAHAVSSKTLTVPVRAQPNTTETKLKCQVESLITGESTRCTATVTDKADNGVPTPPSGTVSFIDNTQAGTFTPASCQLQTTGANVASCQAEVELKPTTVANHRLEVSYQGDSAHLTSFEAVFFQVKIKPNTTSTDLTCKATTLITGGATTCTATVTDNSDNNPASSLAGTVVNFTDVTQPGTFTPAICTLERISNTQGRCQTEVEFKPTTVGRHTIEAAFPGDGGAHASSVKSIPIQVNPQPNDTETELSCKATALITGGSTKCTATVLDTGNNGAPSSLAGGTVTFESEAENGAFAPATCTLVAKGATRGSCELEVDFKPTVAGEHLLRATYPGDGGNHAASAGTLKADVAQALHATKITLVCAPATLVLGAGASQCTATVEDTAAAGATHPSGEVKLELTGGEGTLAAKSCNLPDNGQAKVSCQVIAFTPGKAGDHELKASYGGDATHAQSNGTAKVTATAPPPPAAPNTTLAKKPAKRTAAKVATFKFSSDQAGATFQCKVDKKAFKACTSPFKVKVKNGAHTFTVKAVNAQGVADPTPASYKWTVGPVKKRPKR